MNAMFDDDLPFAPQEEEKLPPAHPFVKWAGGKRQLVSQLLQILPPKINTYFEPFVGGGAVFFALANEGRFERAVLNDWNAELVSAYQAIRSFPDDLIRELEKLPINKDEYLRVRAQVPESLTPIQRAARLIYLNKTCFNGLYRVNKKGQFNVPYGKWKRAPQVFDSENLQACSKVLNKAEIHNGDYSALERLVKPGDTVYLDPPYAPLSSTSNFANYTSGGFDSQAQERLAEVFKHLVQLGAHVVESNSDTLLIRELYRGFEIREVKARRSINSKGGKRGPVGELIIVGRRATCHSDPLPGESLAL